MVYKLKAWEIRPKHMPFQPQSIADRLRRQVVRQPPTAADELLVDHAADTVDEGLELPLTAADELFVPVIEHDVVLDIDANNIMMVRIIVQSMIIMASSSIVIEHFFDVFML
jgi:hypothetical protein